MDKTEAAEKTLRLSNVLHTFISRCDDLENEEDPGGDGFDREFRTLRELGMRMRDENTHPADEGRKPVNVRKNRYKDILPFDETRVALTPIPGKDGSDYINANFIKNPDGVPAYIASQGPLPATVNDFWRLLWQYKVKVVTMACKLVELGKKKCEQYWPSEKGQKTAFGDINVTLNEEINMADNCTVRYLEMEMGGNSSSLIQYHYTGWPDHDIPDDKQVILNMIAEIRTIRQNDPRKAPVVVHCSAGCGRTGTICAIDYAWDLLKSGNIEKGFDLFEIIKEMRQQRQSMIQTPDQYKMAHLAVKQLFEEHLKMLEDHDYGNVDFGQQEETNSIHSGSEGGGSGTGDSERRPSNYEIQVNQTLEHYVNMSIQPPVKEESNTGHPAGPNSSPGAPPSSPLRRPPTPTKPPRHSKELLDEKGATGSQDIPVKERVSAHPSSQFEHQPMRQTNTTGAVAELQANTPNNAPPSLNGKPPTVERLSSSTSDGGRHVTVISVLSSSEHKSAPIVKANSVPTSTDRSKLWNGSDQKVGAPLTNQMSVDSAMSSGAYSYAKNVNFIESSREQSDRATEGTANMAPATQRKVEDIYAQVNKSDQGFKETPSYNPYEAVNVAGNGSSADQTPPIPDRRYLQQETNTNTNTAELDRDPQEVSKTESVKQKIKNLVPFSWSGNKSSGSSSDHSTADLPGFNQRLGKKPAGPRMASWPSKS